MRKDERHCCFGEFPPSQKRQAVNATLHDKLDFQFYPRGNGIDGATIPPTDSHDQRPGTRPTLTRRRLAMGTGAAAQHAPRRAIALAFQAASRLVVPGTALLYRNSSHTPDRSCSSCSCESLLVRPPHRHLQGRAGSQCRCVRGPLRERRCCRVVTMLRNVSQTDHNAVQGGASPLRVDPGETAN
jgi:hypothetical protein